MAANLKSSEVPKWEASTKPLMNTEDWRDKILSKYFDVNNTDIRAIVVPGLRGAWSIDPKTKKAAYGTTWTPQGITQTDKYVFISAYDGKHKLNSLIFVTDLQGKYVKTLIMDSTAHLGGLAYDKQNNNLWISNDEKGARLSSVSLSAVDSYDAKKTQLPIKMNKNYRLPWLTATSTITISDGVLYIPYFYEKAASAAVGLPLVNGEIDMSKLPKEKIKSTSDKGVVEKFKQTGAAEYVRFYVTFKQVQGATIYKSLALFTTSFGNKDSKVIFAEVKKLGESEQIGSGGSFEFNKLDEINSAPYLEQIGINEDSNQFLMLFESGSNKYRHKTPYVMDRVILLDMDLNKLESAARDLTKNSSSSASSSSK